MKDIASIFREYARLDLMRMDSGLTLPEFERWARLKQILDRRLRGSEPPERLERRSSKRLPTRLRCSYSSGDELRKAVVTTLATGGVFINTRSPLPIGAMLVLEIRIEDSGAEIEVEGVVVSNNVGPDLDPHAVGMGVRFSKVSPQMVDGISALYAREAQREYLGAEREESAGCGAASNPSRRSA